MRSEMYSTIMICNIVIWYLSAWWKKTEKDSPVESCQGPVGPGRH